MDAKDLSRRDFHIMSLSALGGALAGVSLAGCNGSQKDGADTGAGGEKAEAHVCRGLNSCKGKGAGGDNACAGQGKCATAAKHTCAGKNECKGLGGCQGKAAANDCKGKGGCSVPLMGDAWKGARDAFEAKMKAEGKTFGAAPAA
jgi:hypothetical protein